ncbi:MAG: hypothetical protein WA004_02030 [Saprospiraceae bacterium]
MRNTINKLALPALFLLGLISCKNEKDYNCYGLRVPDFKNPMVDSLVRAKDAAMCAVVEKLEKGEEPSFEEGLEYGQNGMRHMTIFEILDKDGDQKEIDKYGDYNLALGEKSSEFNKKMQERMKEKQQKAK